MKIHRLLRCSLPVLLAATMGAALSACGKGSSDPNKELYVYNWGEYIDQELISQFEQETGIHVIYDTFETNEEMLPIIETGAVRYDVVCPSDYIIRKMIEKDLLQPIDFDQVPNFANIDPIYLEKSRGFDPENRYSVPYCWGTVGIIYNTALVDEADSPTSWADLWNPKYKNNILMQDSVRDAFMVGEKLLGYDINTTDPKELQAVKEKLIEQKPLVQAYVIDQVRDKMIGGEAAMAVIYSGEMLYIQNEVAASGADYELRYVIPKEGTNVWIDSWVIPKNAAHKENAEKWIDFMCRADVAKKNFEYITYPTPNKAAFELLDANLRNNKALFPDAEALEKSQVYTYLGEDGDALYDNLWKEVKAE